MRTLTADSRDTSIRFRRRRRGALTDAAATNELTLAVLFFVNTFPSRSVEFWWVGAHLDHDPSLINLVIGVRRVRVVPGITLSMLSCCGHCSVRILWSRLDRGRADRTGDDRCHPGVAAQTQLAYGPHLLLQCPQGSWPAQCPTASPTEAAEAANSAPRCRSVR